ncbi:MAG: type II toxin-antitoxin system RelE/ParE family toxin [Candidatus Kapabacteria bacterium]|nr:type II toxin-antitoxin system RelE/ParE family toxin [Candidatus Kapabacteria bacterium]
MITSFSDRATQDVFDGDDTKSARRIPRTLWAVARRKLDLLNASNELLDLIVPAANRLEALKGSLKGFHSIRINDQYRIVFRWNAGNADDVQIIDYH